jgi:threonine dehydrogenase-like Zn-dependent dehydrogenase
LWEPDRSVSFEQRRRSIAGQGHNCCRRPRSSAPNRLSAWRRPGPNRYRLAGSSAEVVADVVFEASGSVAGLKTALRQVRRGGTVVVVGQFPTGDVPLPASTLVTAEVTVAGSLRLRDEFPDALAFLALASTAVDSIVTDILPVNNVLEAFAQAGGAGRSSKVLLDFSSLRVHGTTGVA